MIHAVGLREKWAELVGAEYIPQWDRVRDVLPADVLEELDSKGAPYVIDARGWSMVLMQFMPHGPAGGRAAHRCALFDARRFAGDA